MKYSALRANFPTILWLSFILSVAGYSQNTPSPSAPAQVSPRISAEFDKLVHAKRVKVGDTVTAHLTAPAKLPGGTELPKGSKLVGTITEVKVKSDSEGPSKIGMLFTQVVPRNGPEMPIKVALVSIAPHFRQNEVDPLAAGNPYAGSGRLQAGTASGTLNSTTTEGEALSRGLGARAPAGQSNVAEAQMEPGNSYLPDVKVASYSAAAPGTVLECKTGAMFIDGGSRLLFLAQ